MNNSESSATVEDLEILVSRYRDELKALKLERNDAIAALGDCQRQLSETQRRSGIGTWDRQFDVDKVIWSDEKTIAEDTQIAAYRIVQEGLTNVARHAFVQSASIRIHRQEDQLEIVIADQGVGIVAPSVEESENIGISGMRERASLLGGSVAVQSTPGEGTKLIARLPVSTVRNFCRDFAR